MKVIITESQHNKLWLLRRYDLVKSEFYETLGYVDPCKFKTFETYERYFYNVFMDSLHPEYYMIDNFDYDGVAKALMDLFYVELTEHYFEKKERCL